MRYLCWSVLIWIHKSECNPSTWKCLHAIFMASLQHNLNGPSSYGKAPPGLHSAAALLGLCANWWMICAPSSSVNSNQKSEFYSCHFRISNTTVAKPCTPHMSRGAAVPASRACRWNVVCRQPSLQLGLQIDEIELWRHIFANFFFTTRPVLS